MNTEITENVWKAMLDADLNSRYWRYLGLRYTRRDGYARIFLAATASVTVASWTVWSEIKIIWQTFSVVSALISVGLPIVDIPHKVEITTDAQAAWLQLMYEYEDLWVLRNSHDDKSFAEKYTSLRNREVEMSRKTAKLASDDISLANRCYAEVLSSRGLTA